MTNNSQTKDPILKTNLNTARIKRYRAKLKLAISAKSIDVIKTNFKTTCANQLFNPILSQTNSKPT